MTKKQIEPVEAFLDLDLVNLAASFSAERPKSGPVRYDNVVVEPKDGGGVVLLGMDGAILGAIDHPGGFASRAFTLFVPTEAAKAKSKGDKLVLVVDGRNARVVRLPEGARDMLDAALEGTEYLPPVPAVEDQEYHPRWRALFASAGTQARQRFVDARYVSRIAVASKALAKLLGLRDNSAAACFGGSDDDTTPIVVRFPTNFPMIAAIMPMRSATLEPYALPEFVRV